jgi:hypothetical protein
MQDDQLSPEERARLDALPRTVDPPYDLEDRVVRRLRAEGTLRPRRRLTPWWQVAAALAIFLAGVAAGRVELPAAEPEGPRYLLLLYGGEPATPEAEEARIAEYRDWAGALVAENRLIAAERLDDRGEVLGAPQSPARSDAPSGFFLITAPTLAAAEAIAAECPHLRYGGTVVVRPVAPVTSGGT